MLNWVIVVFVTVINSINNDSIYSLVPALQTNHTFNSFSECASKASEMQLQLFNEAGDLREHEDLAAWPGPFPFPCHMGGPEDANTKFKCVPT